MNHQPFTEASIFFLSPGYYKMPAFFFFFALQTIAEASYTFKNASK